MGRTHARTSSATHHDDIMARPPMGRLEPWLLPTPGLEQNSVSLLMQKVYTSLYESFTLCLLFDAKREGQGSTVGDLGVWGGRAVLVELVVDGAHGSSGERFRPLGFVGEDEVTLRNAANAAAANTAAASVADATSAAAAATTSAATATCGALTATGPLLLLLWRWRHVPQPCRAATATISRGGRPLLLGPPGI